MEGNFGNTFKALMDSLDVLAALDHSLLPNDIILESFKIVDNYFSTSNNTSFIVKKFCFSLKLEIFLPVFMIPLLMLRWDRC